MITAELSGGLGNQMFQIATAISLAKDNGDNTVFDFKKHKSALQGKNATEYTNSVYKNLKDGKFDIENVFTEKSLRYSEIPYSKNLKIEGYFQSEKYFIKNREDIINTFSPTEDEIASYLGLLNNISKNNEENISLHVRRGDYIGFSHIYQVVDLDYINSALSLFNNTNVFIFSDDIKWCIDNIKNEKNRLFFMKQDQNNDYLDMYLMSVCDHNIISNSSFSWWGAWLNTNPNKKIIAPKRWFSKNSGLMSDDIYINNSIIL